MFIRDSACILRLVFMLTISDHSVFHQLQTCNCAAKCRFHLHLGWSNLSAEMLSTFCKETYSYSPSFAPVCQCHHLVHLAHDWTHGWSHLFLGCNFVWSLYLKARRLIGLLYHNFYSYSDAQSLLKLLPDYGVVPPGVFQLGLGFLGNSYILIKTKCAKMCTYFAFCDWNIYNQLPILLKVLLAKFIKAYTLASSRQKLNFVSYSTSHYQWLLTFPRLTCCQKSCIHTWPASGQCIQPHCHNPFPIPLCSCSKLLFP